MKPLGHSQRSNPMSPREAYEAMRLPHGPPPVGRQEILMAKAHILGHRKAVADTESHIPELEAELNRLDPQTVCACAVPGYQDPPERVERAKADKAAGIAPDQTVMTSHIHEIKRHILQLQGFVQSAEMHHNYLEYDLSRLDPRQVCEARVPGYCDPAGRKAAAAKAAGISIPHNLDHVGV